MAWLQLLLSFPDWLTCKEESFKFRKGNRATILGVIYYFSFRLLWTHSHHVFKCVKLATAVFSSLFNYKTFMLLPFHARASKKATYMKTWCAGTQCRSKHVDIERIIWVTYQGMEWSYLSEYLRKKIFGRKTNGKKRLRKFEHTLLSHYTCMSMLVQKPTTYSFDYHHLAP